MVDDNTKPDQPLSDDTPQAPDSLENIRYPGDSELEPRLAKLENEIKKQKKKSLITALIGLFLGGGGVLGFLQWAYVAPLKRTNEKQSAEIAKHDAAVESLISELGAARELGDGQHVRGLLVELIDREKSFRSTISPLQSFVAEWQTDVASGRMSVEEYFRTKGNRWSFELGNVIQALTEQSEKTEAQLKMITAHGFDIAMGSDGKPKYVPCTHRIMEVP